MGKSFRQRRKPVEENLEIETRFWDEAFQGLSFDVLRGNQELSVHFLDPIESGNMGMVETGYCFGLCCLFALLAIGPAVAAEPKPLKQEDLLQLRNYAS